MANKSILSTGDKIVENIIERFVFEQNNSATRRNVTKAFNRYLKKLPLVDFKVVCNSKNNSLKLVSEGKLSVAIYFKEEAGKDFKLMEILLTKG